MSNDKVLGIVVIARHGDRQGFYQDPESYTASATSITALGETQEFALGSLLRSLYLNASSPTYIQGIANTSSLFQQNQVAVRADAGGEGGVIFDSAIALLQGLWPATSLSNTTLADGTTVVSPLGGYQYVPIESVEPNQDVSLEGFTSCNTLNTRISNFYDSDEFLAKANQSANFLSQLKPYMDGRAVTLENMWNIFDYMNVQSIHSAAFAQSLPNTFLAQARDLANFHEYGVFSDASIDGIGNIAARTMLPSILTAFNRIANSSDPLKLHYSSISYKPFLSLFNMTGVVQSGELPAAIVNYAASIVLEVRQPASGGEPVIRFNFKNGTDDTTYHAHNLTFSGWNGQGDVPLSTFTNTFKPAAINTTLQWCNVCGQTSLRGCGDLLGASPSSVSASSHHERFSLVGAGFLGAGLTAAVLLMSLAALIFFGILTFGSKNKKTAHARFGSRASDSGSESHSVRKA
ncbi:hypothetical protein QCA50_006457 [Cerrena zonata]|uniref:Phosphoglycerate mutase-like protein n=1 Tax=Cerrena zonata TaxID=2478898 RepID=A0AAW0G8Q7_9APHY